MKTFAQLREKKESKEVLFSKRVNRATVTVKQDKKGFAAFIDGDKLDTFKTQKEAESAGIAFAKEL